MKNVANEMDGGAEQGAMLLEAVMMFMHGSIISELKEVELRPPQATFLVLMLHLGSINMSALSRITNITLSVATRFVGRLENKGMVERVHDENDRRVVLVSLTDKGRQTAGRLVESYNAKFEELFRGVDPEDLEAFQRVLHHMHQLISEHLDLEIFEGMAGSHNQENKD